MARSRSALLAAAVGLVSERGTTDLSVTDLAEAANVGRQLVYVQFGDRESLLVEAVADLVRRELMTPTASRGGDERERTLVMAGHFARYRSFYRAMLTGSCAFGTNRTLSSVFSPFNKQVVRELFGELDHDVAEDLTAFLTAGAAEIVNTWLIDGDDPLEPEDLANRLRRLVPILTGTSRCGAA